MNLAAGSHVDFSIDRSGSLIETNISGTFNLLQATLAVWKGLPDARELKDKVEEENLIAQLKQNP
mgnify:CR=1 FL=1